MNAENLTEHHWAPIQDQINHVVGRMSAAINSVGPFAACDRPDCPICCARQATEPCGLGMCAANAGHEGTCAEASGWADE